MLTPEQLAYCADDMIKLYSRLDEAIVRDIARRITKAGTLTETGRLQINALQNVGMLYDDILKTISSYTGKSESVLFDLFENAALWSVEYDMDIYAANGLNPIPLNMSPAAMQVLEAGYIKTNGNINNLTRTTAVTSQTSFIDACTFAEMKAESGAFSYEQAIADAIKQIAIPGGYVLYPSGHKDRIDVAVRRNVMTGVGQTTGQICLGYAQDMGCDLMEITAHCGARPSHAQWQGQVVSLSGRKGYLSLSDIGYGTGDGFKGWNCRHDWYPYFEGSPRMYSEKDIEELNAENIKFPDGSMHTYYEAEQYQRAYERAIRETKRILAAQDECIKNTSSESLKRAVQNDFDKFAVKLKKQEAKLNDFCNKTGLLKDNARVQKYGFGRRASQKAVWSNKKSVAKSSKKSIIKNIDVDDFEVVTYGKNIDAEVSKVIVDVMTKCETEGGFVISEIVAKSIPPTQDGTPVLQIEPLSNGLLQLNLNTDILSGKTLEEVNQLFADSDISIVDSLKEAVIHESGHAKSIFGKRSDEIKKFYDDLKKLKIEGISDIALKDGAEALAELEVLRTRGENVPQKLIDFYEENMGRKFK